MSYLVLNIYLQLTWQWNSNGVKKLNRHRPYYGDSHKTFSFWYKVTGLIKADVCSSKCIRIESVSDLYINWSVLAITFGVHMFTCLCTFCSHKDKCQEWIIWRIQSDSFAVLTLVASAPAHFQTMCRLSY